MAKNTVVNVLSCEVKKQPSQSVLGLALVKGTDVRGNEMSFSVTYGSRNGIFDADVFAGKKSVKRLKAEKIPSSVSDAVYKAFA